MVLRDFEKVIAFREAEYLTDLFERVQRRRTVDLHFYQKHLPHKLTVRKAAHFLGTTANELRRKIEAGELRAVNSRNGKCLMIPREEIQRLMNEMDSSETLVQE
jgi:excisionase family DNA binding protein